MSANKSSYFQSMMSINQNDISGISKSSSITDDNNPLTSNNKITVWS